MGAVWSVWSYFFPPRDTPDQQLEERHDLDPLLDQSMEVPSEGPSIKMDADSPMAQESAMDQRCRLALQKSHREFIQDLDVKRTVDYLYSKLVLTSEDKLRIKGMTTDHDRRRSLLDLLPKKGQRAYRGLCETLVTDQPWLKAALDKNYKNITEDDLTRIEQHLDLQTDRSTDELQEILKHKLQSRLDEWKTALEEGVSDREGLLPYINQPCELKRKGSELQSVLNTIQLVEKTRPGDRLTLYGEAGMGKTTLLKEITRCWIEGSSPKLVDKFKYVFLIPLRLVGKISLLNIICDELGLIPVSNSKNLKEALDRNERKTPFLLDSFEELRRDIVEAESIEIDDLITGKLFPESTVVITSRPGSKLKRAEAQKKAYLKDLPEHEVTKIIKQHFSENENAVDKVQRSFPAMAYLQKPINLALFIFIITQNRHLALELTQAELFSLVLQYLMLAFAKKKKLEEFTPQPGSYINNKAIPRDIRRLFKDIAKKCYEGRNEFNVELHLEDSGDLQEYLDFGLFTAGTETNTVLLPHRLFIEYFSAAYLAEYPDVWKALFDELKENTESESPRPSLTDVVRAMGLENVLKFLIALSPQPQQEQVCLQVGSLFVVERMKIDRCENYRLVNFEYYAELMRDPSFKRGNQVIATALANAPVKDVTDTMSNGEDRSHILLQYLDCEQCVTFLREVHNLELCVKVGRSVLSCACGNNRLGIGDRFAVAVVYRYDCVIEADEWNIIGEYASTLDLPASLLTPSRISGVGKLRLQDCTLHVGVPDYILDIGLSATVVHSPCPTDSSLKRVELFGVEGVEYCDFILSCQCQLQMTACDDVRQITLKNCFPKVSELELCDTAVVCETEGELRSWLSTVEIVRRLELAPPRDGESLSLSRLLNVLAERDDLEHLQIYKYTLSLEDKDAIDIVKQNNALSKVRLYDFERDVDLGQLLEVCGRQCPQLEEISVRYSNLIFDDEPIEPVKQMPGLRKFILSASPVHTPAGRRLNYEEVKQHLRRRCPSAEVYLGHFSD